ncbi:MAG: RiPP maturation radical SAM C-methyltransferase [Proteobacteria bacterium]|nr:RiPP maturation radical SAM C-methyltransferase [Pseudomonadota bacterium]MBU1717312.1 RiPP maturation radical SAM C-methyltransferase [Pseudomonadota bacterium]
MAKSLLSDKNIPFCLTLVSMPWSIFNRPSLQLGALKAFVEKSDPGTVVSCCHPYLDVAARLGGDVYHWISLKPWVCEALYVPLIFPEKTDSARKLVAEELRKSSGEIFFDFDQVVAVLKDSLNAWIDGCDWHKCGLVGFSVCFNQLFASLVAAKALKKKYPDLLIVFGGSSCAKETGVSLISEFPQIDFVVPGEGELPLIALVEFLKGITAIWPSSVIGRAGHGADRPERRAAFQVHNLHDLPVPDYGDYFREMVGVFDEKPFIPVLPLEFSRGCWWGKCVFCNLNLQWCGYRHKKADQMLKEVVTLSDTYHCLDYSFTDNVLPSKEAAVFFKEISLMRRDYNFFAEIRVDQGSHLELYRAGGLITAQIGIEAFSNSILQKFNKGSSVIENFAVMKKALACGMEMEGNLIIEFPGCTSQEVAETMINLEFALPFSPLATASFFLGEGSPVARTPSDFGLRAMVCHPQYAKLVPEEILKNLVLLIRGYRGDRKVQQKLWAPVVRKVKGWRDFHRQRGQSATARPLLSYRDGGDFMVIRQELPGTPVLRHRLKGLSRRIYLACDQISDLHNIRRKFQGVAVENLLYFMDDLVKKRLMFRQGDKYLSLAVRDKAELSSSSARTKLIPEG